MQDARSTSAEPGGRANKNGHEVWQPWVLLGCLLTRLLKKVRLSDEGWGVGLRRLLCPLPHTCAVCRAWLGARGQLRSVCLAQWLWRAPAQPAPAVSPPRLPSLHLVLSSQAPGGGLHTSPQYSEKDWLLGVAFVQPADPGKQLGTGKKEPCLDLDLVLGWGPLQETLRRCWGARHKLECTQESPGDLVQMQILAGFWGGAEESLMGSLLVSKPQVSCAHPSSLQPGFCPLFNLALHHQTC